MSYYALEVDLPVEDEAAHAGLLGHKHTPAGDVEVEATSAQLGEVCTFRILGEMPAILTFLAGLWESYEEALDELGRARAEDRLQLA
jgi:hypothetical protein